MDVDIVTRNDVFRIYTYDHTRQKVSHSAWKLTVKGQLTLTCRGRANLDILLGMVTLTEQCTNIE